MVGQDVTELTKLLMSGGGSRMAIEKLEQSIHQLRDMFTVRYMTSFVGERSYQEQPTLELQYPLNLCF